jgi:uncharacterized MAPEG superfamily protein
MLEGALGVSEPCPMSFRLTSAEARVFGVILSRPMATKEMTMTAFYADRLHDDEVAEPKIVDGFVCKICGKIKPFGVTIEAVWGQGWQMSAKSKAIVRDMLEQERRKNPAPATSYPQQRCQLYQELRPSMTVELTLLAWATVLGLLHAVATGQYTTLQHARPLSGIGARVERAFTNYMQTFPFFAAAILLAHVAGRHSSLTIVGANMYFWARLVYVPLYAAGIPIARTIAFLVALLGIAFVLLALA